MDFRHDEPLSSISPSSSSISEPNHNSGASAAASSSNNTNHHNNGVTNNHDDPMHSWWESISKARSRILSLSSLLPPSSAAAVASHADSDRPARSLLSSAAAYSALSAVLSAPLSGSGSDPLCQWLYDTLQSSDDDLRLVALSLIPLLAGLYLSRIITSSASPSLSGFEAVLLSLYAAETKARAGKPILITVPDLSQPSLYHTPRPKSVPEEQSRPSVGVVSPPLEPQIAVKSTKRAGIVGVALECYFKQISQMPSWSKLDLCRFANAWAGQDCPCKSEFDQGSGSEIDGFSEARDIRIGDDEIESVAEEMRNIGIQDGTVDLGFQGARIPLPWELLQPILRIIGHCLLAPLNSQDVKDAASVAVRCLYARASHDLVPQAILATQSLIRLDKRAREAASVATANASNANTPSKAKKPEVLLVSK